MKFCYIDESATGDGSLVVAVGLVVDAQRMHLSKAEWQSRLSTMSRVLGASLREFKAKDLYQGSGRWARATLPQRTQTIDALVRWVGERKHKVVYSGVRKDIFDACTRPERPSIPDAWCAADEHLLLALQRAHQSAAGQKGHTVIVMDRGRHDEHLVGFVRAPDPWTDAYYAKPVRAERLSHIVDVPYFVDSEHALLVQTADLFAYILRRYVQLEDLGAAQGYAGERPQVATWAKRLATRAERSHMYPATGRTSAHDLFREIAPAALVTLRP